MAKKRPLNYNYAQDKEFSISLAKHILEIWYEVKKSRETREDEWQEHYRAWSVDKTDSDNQYMGRANIKMPQIRKEVETMSRRIIKGLFPDDYIQAEAHQLENEDLAEVNSQVVQHYHSNVMKTKLAMIPFVKQGVLYGTSPIRQFWKKEQNDIMFRERYFVDNKDGVLEPKFKQTQKKITVYDAPVLRTEDMFQTWVYPTTATRPEDLEMVFWRTKVTDTFLKHKAKNDQCAHLDVIKDHDKLAAAKVSVAGVQGKERDWNFEETQERMQQFGESGVLNPGPGRVLFNLLEVWIKLELPGMDEPVPVVVEIIEEAVCSRIQRNPYWHQSPPIDFMRFIIPPGTEFYGRGLPEASISVQHQLNDTLNQTMDSATLSLNNVTIINPAYAPNADSFEVESGAIWWADPNAVKQMQFPDLSDTGYKNAGQLRSIITELSDNSPQLPDPIAGKARSTGQAQLAVNEWQTDLYTILEQIMMETMNPIASKTHILLQQNMDDKNVIRISGKYAGEWINRIVSPEEVVGTYIFKWIGSLQMENKAVKAQQMLNLLRLLPQIPPEAGLKFNYSTFVTRLMRDAWQIKDPENIVETARRTASTPPLIENKILMNNGTVKVNESDDDPLHIKNHMAESAKLKPSEANYVYKKANFDKHIFDHTEQLKKKQAAAQMAQQQMQMMMAQQNPGGPQVGQRGPGNPQQIPESTSPENIERGMRIET